MQIPFEIFSLMEGLFLFVSIIGLIRNPQIPATIVIGGLFMLVIAVLASDINLGQLVDTATTTGDTTTFTYTDDNYTIADLSTMAISFIIGIYALSYVTIGAWIYKLLSPFSGVG